MATPDPPQLELAAWMHASPEKLCQYQDRRFSQLLRHHFNNSRNPAYRRLLHSVGIEHEYQLPTCFADIGRLPKITRQFLAEANYADQPAVASEEIRKVIETSGSSGTPLRLPHAHHTVARCYGMSLMRAALLSGINPSAASYFVGHWVPGGKDVWTSHEAMQAFAERVGNSALIESTHSSLADHLARIQAHRALWGASTPTFFLSLSSFAEQQGLDPASLGLRHLLLGGGTCLPASRGVLMDAYGLESARLIYATSESFLLASELAGEAGYLCFSDEYLIEVVDEEDRPVQPGERGRILITCLANYAYPGIRYMQGDTVTFVGFSETYPGFLLIDRPERVDGGEIGEARLLITEIEAMQRKLLHMGHRITAFQVARRRLDSRDLPVIRLESIQTDQSALKSDTIQVFSAHPVMADMLAAGMIRPPEVELYAPGELMLGRAKVPSYVDESNLPKP